MKKSYVFIFLMVVANNKVITMNDKPELTSSEALNVLFATVDNSEMLKKRTDNILNKVKEINDTTDDLYTIDSVNDDKLFVIEKRLANLERRIDSLEKKYNKRKNLSLKKDVIRKKLKKLIEPLF